eukprot:755961-Hanusia_phi.AAC.13
MALAQITAIRKELSNQDPSLSFMELVPIQEASGYITDADELYLFLYNSFQSHTNREKSPEEQSFDVNDLSSVKAETSVDVLGSAPASTSYSEADPQSWLQPALTAKSYLGLVKTLGFHHHIEKSAALLAFSIWARSDTASVEEVKRDWRLLQCLQDMLEASEIDWIGQVTAGALKALIKNMKRRLHGTSPAQHHHDKRARRKSRSNEFSISLSSSKRTDYKGPSAIDRSIRPASNVEWELWKLMKQSGEIAITCDNSPRSL